jgi:hypothetical protein
MKSFMAARRFSWWFIRKILLKNKNFSLSTLSIKIFSTSKYAILEQGTSPNATFS